jgi:PPOX class probable F420-dependent enzyme
VSNTEIPESHRDLLDSQVVILTTNGADGYPQSTATWFLNDDGTVKISIHRDRQKYKNLARDPKVTLFFLDGANPYRTLEVRGDASYDDDGDKSFFTRVLLHYGQDPETSEIPADNRVVVTVTPTRVNAFG